MRPYTTVREAWEQIPGDLEHISLLHLNLPAGTYLLSATVEFRNDAAFVLQENTRHFFCSFSGDENYFSRIAGPSFLTMSFHAVLNISSGGVDFNCASTNGNPTNLFGSQRRLTAVKIEGAVIVQ